MALQRREHVVSELCLWLVLAFFKQFSELLFWMFHSVFVFFKSIALSLIFISCSFVTQQALWSPSMWSSFETFSFQEQIACRFNVKDQHYWDRTVVVVIVFGGKLLLILVSLVIILNHIPLYYSDNGLKKSSLKTEWHVTEGLVKTWEGKNGANYNTSKICFSVTKIKRTI